MQIYLGEKGEEMDGVRVAQFLAAALAQILLAVCNGEIDTDTFKAKQNQIQDDVIHLEASSNAHTMANFDYIDRAEKILEL